MKRLVLNALSAAVVALGALALTTPETRAAESVCIGDLQLWCGEDICCVICYATGEVLSCSPA